MVIKALIWAVPKIPVVRPITVVAAAAAAFVGQWTCDNTLKADPMQPWCPTGTCNAPTQASIVKASSSTITTTFSTGSTGTCVLGWTVDGKVATLFPAGQMCSNCALYQGKATDAAAACPLFAGKQVSAKGWCSAWAKKG